jgi:hypothetical protein
MEMEMEGVDHLASERSKAQFDVEEMKVVWAGSRHALEVSDRISRLVASAPVLFLYLLLLFFSFSSVWIPGKCAKRIEFDPMFRF